MVEEYQRYLDQFNIQFQNTCSNMQLHLSNIYVCKGNH